MKQNAHNDFEIDSLSKMDKKYWTKTILLLIPFVYFLIINIVQPSGIIKYTWHYGIWLPLTTYVVFWEGRKYFKIYKQLFKVDLNMDTLIGLASHILYVYSVVLVFTNLESPMYSYDVMWEGPVVLIMVTNIGHKLEGILQKSALETYQKLENMRTSKVNVYRNNELITIPADEVSIGEIIMVEPGGFVPLDGILLTTSIFDYSNITGESKEINLEAGKLVVSGSYNLSGRIKIKVVKDSRSSTIAHIVDKIEEVASTRPKMQVLADKVLKIFVPLVLTLSFLTFITWLTIGYTIGINVPWINNSSVITTAISAGVTVIAIACPCALGIATPLVYTVSSMLASKHGMIINNPKVLETLNEINIIAFDKTGTLTTQEMKVSKIHGDLKYLKVARTLEDGISHPIAKAIVKTTKAKTRVSKILQKRNVVSGVWNGNDISIKRYIGKEFKVSIATTNIALYIKDKPVLVFELTNEIKNGVRKTIQRLQKNGITPVMVTGDDKRVSEHIGQIIGIKRIYSNVKPNEKAKIIKQLQTEGNVMFVGDGFNDSIAIKQAHASIAFASGSDITNSLADLTIVSSSFYSIFKFFTLAKMNKKNVKMALTYAMLFNFLTIPIAMLLLVQPWVGASIMAVSDVLVSLNAYAYKKLGKNKLNR